MLRKLKHGHGEKLMSGERDYKSNVMHKKTEKNEGPSVAKRGSVHLKHIVPDLSQGGLTGVKFIAHEAQSAGHVFQPFPFHNGLEKRLYGGVEHQIVNTRGEPHRVRMNSENLQKMVESTVGNAYNLANPGHDKVGPAHKDNTVKGSLLGFKSATEPCRVGGQVPYAGRFF
jgi:hypothetical protein